MAQALSASCLVQRRSPVSRPAAIWASKVFSRTSGELRNSGSVETHGREPAIKHVDRLGQGHLGLMVGRQPGEQPEIDLDRSGCRAGLIVDGDLGPGTAPRPCWPGPSLGSFARVDPALTDKVRAAAAGVTVDGPDDGAGHVRDVDQRSPGRAIGKYGDFPVAIAPPRNRLGPGRGAAGRTCRRRWRIAGK